MCAGSSSTQAGRCTGCYGVQQWPVRAIKQRRVVGKRVVMRALGRIFGAIVVIADPEVRTCGQALVLLIEVHVGF